MKFEIGLIYPIIYLTFFFKDTLHLPLPSFSGEA